MSSLSLPSKSYKKKVYAIMVNYSTNIKNNQVITERKKDVHIMANTIKVQAWTRHKYETRLNKIM